MNGSIDPLEDSWVEGLFEDGELGKVDQFLFIRDSWLVKISVNLFVPEVSLQVSSEGWFIEQIFIVF